MRRDWPRSAKPVCAPSAQHADAADALSELRVGGEARLWGISGIDVSWMCDGPVSEPQVSRRVRHLVARHGEVRRSQVGVGAREEARHLWWNLEGAGPANRDVLPVKSAAAARVEHSNAPPNIVECIPTNNVDARLYPKRQHPPISAAGLGRRERCPSAVLRADRLSSAGRKCRTGRQGLRPPRCPRG